MNIFRFAGDMTHLISVLVLLFKIYATKSCSGISLKPQELYALVFLARYLDIFTDFVSVYNTVMKIVFIMSSLAIVWCIHMHPVARRSYDKELDTFRHYFLIGGCLLGALLVREKFTFQKIFWAFSLYLEAVAILPQLVLLQRSGIVDNLTGQYVFFLGYGDDAVGKRGNIASYIVVTHQHSTIRRAVERLIFLHKGKIVWEGMTHEFTASKDPIVS